MCPAGANYFLKLPILEGGERSPLQRFIFVDWHFAERFKQTGFDPVYTVAACPRIMS